MYRLPDTAAERCAPASIEASQYLLYLCDSPEPLLGANHMNDANDSIYECSLSPALSQVPYGSSHLSLTLSEMGPIIFPT